MQLALDAARRDDGPALKDLLAEHPSLANASDDAGTTLAKAAASEGSLSCLRIALSAGADVSAGIALRLPVLPTATAARLTGRACSSSSKGGNSRCACRRAALAAQREPSRVPDRAHGGRCHGARAVR